MEHEAYEAEKARIERFYQKWREPLGLDGWDVARTYHDGPYVQEGGVESGTASTHVMWEYRYAALSFNIQKTRELPDERLEDVVLHECMHILLHELRPLREQGADATIANAYDRMHEERVATSLAWAFMRARET